MGAGTLPKMVDPIVTGSQSHECVGGTWLGDLGATLRLKPRAFASRPYGYSEARIFLVRAILKKKFLGG